MKKLNFFLLVTFLAIVSCEKQNSAFKSSENIESSSPNRGENSKLPTKEQYTQYAQRYFADANGIADLMEYYGVTMQDPSSYEFVVCEYYMTTYPSENWIDLYETYMDQLIYVYNNYTKPWEGTPFQEAKFQIIQDWFINYDGTDVCTDGKIFLSNLFDLWYPVRWQCTLNEKDVILSAVVLEIAHLNFIQHHPALFDRVDWKCITGSVGSSIEGALVGGFGGAGLCVAITSCGVALAAGPVGWIIGGCAFGGAIYGALNGIADHCFKYASSQQIYQIYMNRKYQYYEDRI